MVYIVLGKGFEEAEAIIPCDLLRRAGVQVEFAAIGSTCVCGGHGICVNADCTVEEMDLNKAEMIVFPGGLCGVESILNCPNVLLSAKLMYEQGKYVAAICAAPTILAKLGLLEGKHATCYPGMEEELTGALVCDADTVHDGNIITGRAAGTAFAFGLELVRTLCGEETAQKIATGVVSR